MTNAFWFVVYGWLQDVAEVERAVALQGPVSVAFNANSVFMQFYSSGFYTGKCAETHPTSIYLVHIIPRALSLPACLKQYAHDTANCIIIAQFPIENHSEQGQFAELPLKTIGKSAKFGRLLCNSQ